MSKKKQRLDDSMRQEWQRHREHRCSEEERFRREFLDGMGLNPESDITLPEVAGRFKDNISFHRFGLNN